MEGLLVVSLILCAYFVVGFPISQVLHRIGFSRWWALLWFIPFINVVGLWMVAFRKWPIDAAQKASNLEWSADEDGREAAAVS
jgi:uncharacterized membrane protein YhaH (DUF805 family)